MKLGNGSFKVLRPIALWRELVSGTQIATYLSPFIRSRFLRENFQSKVEILDGQREILRPISQYYFVSFCGTMET